MHVPHIMASTMIRGKTADMIDAPFIILGITETHETPIPTITDSETPTIIKTVFKVAIYSSQPKVWYSTMVNTPANFSDYIHHLCLGVLQAFRVIYDKVGLGCLFSLRPLRFFAPFEVAFLLPAA